MNIQPKDIPISCMSIKPYILMEIVSIDTKGTKWRQLDKNMKSIFTSLSEKS